MVVVPEDPPGAAAKEREAVATLGVKWGEEEEWPVGEASSLVGAGGLGGGCKVFLGPPQGIEARSGKSKSN